MDAAIHAAARYLTRAAALFLVAMGLITVVDIPLRWPFNFPIHGTFDLVELFLVAMVYLAIPETFLREEHIVVGLIDHVTGPRMRAIMKAIASGLALALLVLMEINMIEPAYDMYEFGDETKDLEIPKIVHWLPILLGIACSILALALLFVRDVGRVVREFHAR